MPKSIHDFMSLEQIYWICNMTNSQLYALRSFVDNEIKLSETAITEGNEIRK